MAWPDVTPEEQAKINLVRLLVGDVPGSIFYPALSDEDYYYLLVLENWNVYRAARRAAMSIAFQVVSINYRERTGDIEVWNNASLEYRKVLEMFLDGDGGYNLPPDIIPFVGGISRADVCEYISRPDTLRSPLTQITPCHAWWTNVENYPCCDDNFVFDFGK